MDIVKVIWLDTHGHDEAWVGPEEATAMNPIEMVTVSLGAVSRTFCR